MKIFQNAELIELFDVYSRTLTDNQRLVIKLCVLNDLSYGEAGDVLEISRQAVKYALDNAKAQMLKLEEQLGVIKKKKELINALTEIRNNANSSVQIKIDKIMENM